MAAIDLSFGGSNFPRALEVRQKLYQAAMNGLSSRYRRLDRHDAFYKALEYKHLDLNWDGRQADRFETISPDVILPAGFTQPMNDTPVAGRRPTAPLRLCPMVVDRFTGLLFSEARLPKVSVEGDEDAEDFLQAVFKKARFWRSVYQARTYGGSMGSALLTVQLRKGKFSYTAHSPKIVQDVMWDDPDLKTVSGVLIQYVFEKEVEELDEKSGRPTGRTKSAPYLFRRIIDEEADITFVPEKLRGQELPAEMEIDAHASYVHNLGKFPGVWIQNLPTDDDLDGAPDCEGAYQMFETIDRQLSQSNKGLLANQDPTLVFGRDIKYDTQGIPLRKGSENALNVGLGGDAHYMEMNGAGIAAADVFVKTLKSAAMDRVQCVVADPEAMAGAAQSALAIELLYQPMLEKADRLRQQYGEAIEAMADVTLAIARAWNDPKIYPVNVNQIRFDVPPKVVEEDADPTNPDPSAGRRVSLVERNPGQGGVVSLAWGPYFAQTPTDKQTLIAVWVTALSGGLVDTETAVRKVAPILEIEDVDAVLKRVREEAESKKAEMMGGFGGGFGEPMPEEVPGELPPEEPPVEPPLPEGA